jgi:hypothetical protein
LRRRTEFLEEKVELPEEKGRVSCGGRENFLKRKRE